MEQERLSFKWRKCIKAGPYALELIAKPCYTLENTSDWFVRHKLSLFGIDGDNNFIHAKAKEKLPIMLTTIDKWSTDGRVNSAMEYYLNFIEQVRRHPSHYVSENILRKLLR